MDLTKATVNSKLLTLHLGGLIENMFYGLVTYVSIPRELSSYVYGIITSYLDQIKRHLRYKKHFVISLSIINIVI